jgi:hypothetical protein
VVVVVVVVVPAAVVVVVVVLVVVVRVVVVRVVVVRVVVVPVVPAPPEFAGPAAMPVAGLTDGPGVSATVDDEGAPDCAAPGSDGVASGANAGATWDVKASGEESVAAKSDRAAPAMPKRIVMTIPLLSPPA